MAVFLDPAARSSAAAAEKSDAENAFKNFFKRWPRLYWTITRSVLPLWHTKMSAERFLKGFPAGNRLLNVGSGPFSIRPDIVNVDLFRFPNVHILADAARLPFPDGTFDAVCADQVLEHVPDPHAVVQEFLRVAKPGGLVYVAAPFLFPYHPSPKDYSRWSTEGLKDLFKGHEAVDTGVHIGPTSAFLFVVAAWLSMAFSFGSSPLRKGLNYVFMIVLSPLKLFDAIFTHLPGAEDIAMSVYAIIRKSV